MALKAFPGIWECLLRTSWIQIGILAQPLSSSEGVLGKLFNLLGCHCIHFQSDVLSHSSNGWEMNRKNSKDVMVTGVQEVLSAVEEHIKVSLATLRAPCFIPPDSWGSPLSSGFQDSRCAWYGQFEFLLWLAISNFIFLLCLQITTIFITWCIGFFSCTQWDWWACWRSSEVQS